MFSFYFMILFRLMLLPSPCSVYEMCVIGRRTQSNARNVRTDCRYSLKFEVVWSSVFDVRFRIPFFNDSTKNERKKRKENASFPDFRAFFHESFFVFVSSLWNSGNRFQISKAFSIFIFFRIKFWC